MVGKSKVGKTVGTAAVPAAAPTPLNTPSLKREKGQDAAATTTTGSVGWGNTNTGVTPTTDPKSSEDEGNAKSGSAKPAPWAKDGKQGDADGNPDKPSARGRTRSWADTDESDDDDGQQGRQDSHQVDRDRNWPSNFREQEPPHDRDYDHGEPEYDDHDHRYGQRFDPRQRVRIFRTVLFSPKLFPYPFTDATI